MQLRIVSRNSPLAMWQAEYVRGRLRAAHPGLDVSISGVTTTADRFLDQPLSALGGKGLFVKELEQEMLDGNADLAVHSMKDVPVLLPDGLDLPVILKREDVRDAFISSRFGALDELPHGARVGTSSLRRRCQLLALRPDLEVLELRGNVGTRLGRLDGGDLDAIVLAAAGMARLGLETRVREFLATERMLPAIGQGALGIECRAGDQTSQALIGVLNDVPTAQCVLAERAVNRTLFGGCHVPIAGLARITAAGLELEALVGTLDGRRLLRDRILGAPAEAEQLGRELGARLLDQGAADILREIGHD
ncbi:MAG: hydroxymethylbilane synthase [Gammaproteobacteria bacterium RIFCSPLOWO2_02_FULL_61_13]|nr:MAG: hydroxymethylbilane synthase [Gammaproteobacteria bacterium RIFCSPLOWO2_02_FULL_61_13]